MVVDDFFLFQALVISKSFFCRRVKLFLNSNLNSNKDRYDLSLKIAQNSLHHLWLVTPSRKSALHERITKPFAKQAFRTRPFGCFCFCSAIEQNPFWSWIQTLLFLHVHDLLAKLLMLETIHVEVIEFTTLSLQKAFKPNLLLPLTIRVL